MTNSLNGCPKVVNGATYFNLNSEDTMFITWTYGEVYYLMVNLLKYTKNKIWNLFLGCSNVIIFVN